MQDDTLLHRQVHPHFVDNEGRPTRQTFLLFPKDSGKLSLYNGEKWSAEYAFVNHTETLGLDSLGTLAITILEIAQTKEDLDLELLEAIEDNELFDGHVSLDQNHLMKNQQKVVRTLLLQHAQLRDWTFRKAD